MVGYSEPRRRLACGNLSPSPFFRKAAEARRHVHLLSSKPDAVGFRRRDALRLPLADVLPLRLRNIAEKLENDVGNERSGQIPALPGVQQGMSSTTMAASRFLVISDHWSRISV